MPPALNRLQRAKLRTLRSQVKYASDELTRHLKVCGTCKPGPSFARNACDRGWTLAKGISRAENNLAVFQGNRENPDDNGQLTLW